MLDTRKTILCICIKGDNDCPRFGETLSCKGCEFLRKGTVIELITEVISQMCINCPSDIVKVNLQKQCIDIIESIVRAYGQEYQIVIMQEVIKQVKQSSGITLPPCVIK